MKRNISAVILAAVLACGLSACGADTIPDTVLSGRLNGSDFVAKSAIASQSFFSTSTSRDITITDVDFACDSDFSTLDRSIIFTTEWTPGTKQIDLFNQTVTFVSGGSNNNVSTDGKLIVVSAPSDDNSTGQLKLRAYAGDDSVEGTLSVTVCPAAHN